MQLMDLPAMSYLRMGANVMLCFTSRKVASVNLRAPIVGWLFLVDMVSGLAIMLKASTNLL